LENEIKTVAMESTGTYWQNLYSALIAAGFQVILCNGKFTKNIKGKKTDVKDAQWIQKLHTIGLLTGSFLPDEATEQLRTYCRHRTNMIFKGVPYKPESDYEFLDQKRKRKVQEMKKLIHKFDIKINDLGLQA
jgi:transposase